MNIPIVFGQTLIAFGVDERFNVLPIVGLPPNVLSMKRRIRAKSVAELFIRTKNGVSRHYLAWTQDRKALTIYATVGINGRAN